MMNLPSNIKSQALKDTYYKVQQIIADRYEIALSKAKDSTTCRLLKEQFHRDIRAAIDYYVNLSK